jgi:hypothetical protein
LTEHCIIGHIAQNARSNTYALDISDTAKTALVSPYSPARYVGGWTFRNEHEADARLIGTELRRQLLNHVEKRVDDDDRLGRARRAFGDSSG